MFHWKYRDLQNKRSTRKKIYYSYCGREVRYICIENIQNKQNNLKLERRICLAVIRRKKTGHAGFWVSALRN